MPFGKDTPDELYRSLGFVPNHVYFDPDTGALPPMLSGKPRYPFVFSMHHMVTHDDWVPPEYPWLRAFGRADLFKLRDAVKEEINRR